MKKNQYFAPLTIVTAISTEHVLMVSGAPGNVNNNSMNYIGGA